MSLSRFASMSTEHITIDLTKTEVIEVNPGEDAGTVIANLDFERAELIAASQHNDHTDLLRTSSNRFLLESERYQSDLRDEGDRECARIRHEVQIEIEDIKEDYQTQFTVAVQRHRTEAEDLKALWIAHHQRAEGIARRKLDDIIHTSKVLASLESFESARKLRDDARDNEDSYIAEEVKAGDDHFRSQFRVMIQRHEQQYDALAEEMARKIELAQRNGDIREAKVKGGVQADEAHSPVKMMNDISQADFNPLEKKAIINTLSPGRLGDIRTSPVKLSPRLFE
jgi:hypothetical protein